MTDQPPTPSPPPIVAQPPLLSYGRPRRRLYKTELVLLIFCWVPGVTLILGGLIWLIGNNEDSDFFPLLAFIAGPVGFVALGTLVLLTINTVLRSIISTRTERGRTILGYLENAIRLNFPLDRFLEAAQESERTHRRLQLAQLRMALQQGMGVGAALQVAAPDVPEPVAAALAAAENIGQLQPTLSRLIARDTRHANSEPQTTPFYRFYFPLMLAATLGLTAFFMIFVIPKFRDIFKDFHTTMPPLTMYLLDVGAFFFDNDYVLPTLLILLAVLFVLTAARSLQKAFRFLRGAPQSPFLFNLSFRWMAWYLPFWRQITRDRTLASVMEFLADALRAGLALPQALDAALALSIPPGMRRQFEQWLDGMLGGQTPADASRHAQLPALLTGFLQTGMQTGASSATRAEIFEFLARYYRERFSRARLFLRAAAEPAAALLLGVMVGTVVLAIFLPLVKLIDSVMQGSERGFL